MIRRGSEVTGSMEDLVDYQMKRKDWFVVESGLYPCLVQDSILYL